MCMTSNINSANCSCKVESGGKCKHVTGVLLKLERMNLDEIISATCTELPQKWGKTGSCDYLFHLVPRENFCHLPKRKQKFTFNENDITGEILYSVICEGCPPQSVLK